MSKWARPKSGMFLFLCITAIIVIYAIFKRNLSFRDEHVFFTMPVRHIYSTLVQLQITSTAVRIGTENQIFERVKACTFEI